MLSVPFKIWYGGFAEHVLKNVICEEARDQYIHLEICKDVWEYYKNPLRSYHNEYHPFWMYQFAWENNIILSEAQEIAILFHDAIYIPGDSNNEKDSADYCYNLLSPHCLDDQVIVDACEIIVDTAQHFEAQPNLVSMQSNLILDIDIINMSLPYSEFKKWNKAIDDEYFNFHGINIDNNKRIEFLKHMLDKKPILHSNLLKGREPLIIDNLMAVIREQELQNLE